MPSKTRINKRNKNIIEKGHQKRPDTQLCKCTNKNQCPLNEQHLTESIFYQVNITANIPGYKAKGYLGVSKTTFNNNLFWKHPKQIYYGNHKISFTKQRHKNNKELSKEYWKEQQYRIPIIK